MCGIAGYTGKRKASEVVVDGLALLEYRGYDSAGIALFNGQGNLQITKKAGFVSHLKKAVYGKEGCCGIGHTRWATHGIANETNCHPHCHGKFCIVHNGIIENFATLKKGLQKKGKKFLSQTDTEVVAVLLDEFYNGDVLDALSKVAKMLKGSFAIAILCHDFCDRIYFLKKGSPLLVGVGHDENFVASDQLAFVHYTDRVVFLKDNEMGYVDSNNICLFDFCKNKKVVHVEKSNAKAGNFVKPPKSFMHKEIFEIPKALRMTANDFFNDQDKKQKAIDIFSKNDKVIMIGCGSAYNACLVGKLVWEKVLHISAEVDLASEFRYKNPLVSKGTLVVAVSQSGETADTLRATKLAKSKGADVVAITNVAHSSITKNADLVFHTKAGQEVAVAATKSYVTQVLLFLCIACVLSKDSKAVKEIKKQIDDLPYLATKALLCDTVVAKKAKEFCKKQGTFFVGRGLDYPLAVEGSLKLKEISYMHSQGFAAGELKHGSIALVDKNVLVVGIITQKKVAEKTINALHEVSCRGAKVLVVTQFDKMANEAGCHDIIKLPGATDLLMPILAVVPLQLFAYHVSVARGINPDKPRNLAKSVTVE
ncbi:MAG: glutamine--fructose-6-phosphate transaminase (isomerizing) [Clostridiales bacterium]|nr:glutamine--fructose-6-phosphate transaminase (isomerizing) [Clostridiales bacterium]